MSARVICITGAESCGKSTLAADLSGLLGAPMVREAARDLLPPAYTYGAADVEAIGFAQSAREQVVISSHVGWVVLDTDLTVIRIWLEERFEHWPAALAERLQRQPSRSYVLCAPDIPWAADPLREHPHDRERLHKRYRALLEQIGEPWIEVQGSRAARRDAVMRWIDQPS